VSVCFADCDSCQHDCGCNCNEIFDKVFQGVQKSGSIKQKLFESAYEVKKEYLAQNYQTHKLWDSLVFDNIKQALGGEVRYMVTGSAPISEEVLSFLRVAFSCPVIEGYGQTESSAAISTTQVGDCSTGHVGVPLACNELKLVDVKDMDYTAQDKPFPRGEICVRGPNVFQGYYKDDEKTKEALDSDGWLHTGDIALIDDKLRIKIIDRKKKTFSNCLKENTLRQKKLKIYFNKVNLFNKISFMEIV